MTETLDKIKAILGPCGWSEDPAVIAPWLTDSRTVYQGGCCLFVQPETTEQVAQILKICHQSGLKIVPQGGNTSRCGGATPDAGGEMLLINMTRMKAIRNIDRRNHTMTVEAGCILQNLQQRALDADCFFPLSFGAEGSCTIGGNLATNAGGINVLRYGNMRDLVLGLEVVLPDGRIWHGLQRLRKNNTGYDFKNLFIGSEGTLGIITAAVVKLFPRPKTRATAFCALVNLEDAPDFLAHARRTSGDELSSFELIPEIAVDCASRHIPGIRPPLRQNAEWAILLEFASSSDESRQIHMENLLEDALGTGLIGDAVLASSEQDRLDFWRLREAIVEAQGKEGASIKHDISVPVDSVPLFIKQAGKAVNKICPGIRPYPFGHVGDGNIHYNLSQPPGMSAENFMNLEQDIHRIIHDITYQLDGSFSAEHGVGRLKTGEILRYKDPLEVEMMQALKHLFDPKEIMNPGVLLPQKPRLTAAITAEFNKEV